MKPTFTQPTEFWRERDFGAKISAAFDFIGAHWRRLGKCLLYFVLPSALLMGIGLGLFANGIFSYAALPGRARAYNGSPFSQFNFWGLGLGMLGLLVSVVMLSATVYGYVRSRLRLAATEAVEPRHVWEAIRARLLWVLLAVVVLVGGGYLGLVLVMGLLIAGVAALHLNPLISFLGVVAAMVPLAYVGVALSLYFPVLWLEDQGIFQALGRCFQLIKGQWWATLGLLLVTSIIQSSIGVVFIIPQYAVMFGKIMHLPFLDSDLVGVAAQCIYALGIVFTNTISLLVIAFQYFNLVERHEGFGSRLLLDTLGQPAVALPTLHDDYYRPDEEGEY